MTDTQTKHYDITDLLAIMVRLRDPERGCPWDVEQTFASIAPYTLEEAYEVVDAIERGDRDDLRDELGDLLLQVVFQARLAEEESVFNFADVVQAISAKMVRRHPHVFGDVHYADAAEQTRAWQTLKAAERRADGKLDRSLLDTVSRGLPEWRRAIALQNRAAEVGFDWPELGPVLEKLDEEVRELNAEFETNPPIMERVEDELGDLLFVAANLARHLHIDPARALRHANAKFERRFRWMETHVREAGYELIDLDLSQQENLWQQAKAEERDADQSTCPVSSSSKSR